MDYKSEINLFKLAVSFLTRIPVSVTDYSDNKLNQATGYFPLVGALIGLCLLSVFYLVSLILPMALAITFLLIAGFLLTGGFHEDGLADVADGFGGAFEKTKKLTIMKDSRLGTYGSLALISLFAIKYQALSLAPNLTLSLVIGHTLSRVFATLIIGQCAYVTDADSSKVKPVAQNLPSDAILRIAVTTFLLCLALLFTQLSLLNILVILVSCFILQRVLIAWFKQQINGYTGDCLGAAQQIIEVFIYCLLIFQLS